MKKTLNLIIPLLMLAAFCLPALAQEESQETAQGSLSSDNPDGAAASASSDKTDAPAEKPAARKTAAKNKKRVKQAALPEPDAAE